MKSLACGAILAICLGACGDDDPGMLDVGDAGGTQFPACNPVNQTGPCDFPNEQCGTLVVSLPTAENPNLPVSIVTTCVPAGTVQPDGSACLSAFENPGIDTGFDNCVGGNECVFGECLPVCNVNEGCADDNTQACSRFFELFGDVDGGLTAGVCLNRCDPAAQDCGGVDQGCYTSIESGDSTCSNSFTDAAHGEQCFPGTTPPESCILNSCAPGYQGFGPDIDLAGYHTALFSTAVPITCWAYCNPDPLGPIDGNPLGDPAGVDCGDRNAGVSECRYLNGFFVHRDDPLYIPDNIGVCVPTATWGTCAAENASLDAFAFLFEGDGTVIDPGFQDYIPGCWTGTAVAEVWNNALNPPAAAPTSQAKPQHREDLNLFSEPRHLFPELTGR